MQVATGCNLGRAAEALFSPDYGENSVLSRGAGWSSVWAAAWHCRPPVGRQPLHSPIKTNILSKSFKPFGRERFLSGQYRDGIRHHSAAASAAQEWA